MDFATLAQSMGGPRRRLSRIAASALIAGMLGLLAMAETSPRLFKSTRYPPVTREEKALWDWWRRMHKEDPKFEWKMPIQLYGVVRDQSGAPVSNATVQYRWTTLFGGKTEDQATGTTDAEGRFVITGIKGKRMKVEISKAGYLRTSESFGSFEYAAFFDELFHEPDARKPVSFRL